ncbi:MAG: hypothetical protein ACYC7D_11430 [Nitrososphaerales archaeon]
MSEKSSTEVITKIRNISAVKSDENANHNAQVVFNFGVNMDEADRKNDSVKLNFQMNMDTEPSIVKFSIEGSVFVHGEISEIEKILSADPQTNVPYVFTRVYQEVYAVIFLLAGNLDVPYPSPALLKRAQVRTAISDAIRQ